MSLHAKLNRPLAFEQPSLADIKDLGSAKDRILSRWPDIIVRPPERDRDRLVAEMLQHLEQDRWDGVRTSFVTAAAEAAFDEKRRERPELAALRDFYFNEVEVSTRSNFLNAMASIYLESYVPGAEHTRALSRSLQAIQSRLGAQWRSLFDRLPECLDPIGAPEAVAKLMIEMDQPWTELKTLGLRLPHAPGLMDHAHLAYLDRLRSTLRHRHAIDRLFAWLKPNGQSARVSGAAEAIAAVLGHWLRDNPSAEDVGHITHSLIGFYGDPRVLTGGAWAGVPPDCLAVLMRWLTGENIRFFLDVVSAVEDSHMWEPRRRFWLKLYEQNRIDAAWVAFSQSGADYARHIARSRGSRASLNYGHQIAGGNRANTSLLILKIGSRIVVEGSHSYKIHIFRENNPRKPELYQRQYDCERIRLIAGSESKSHLGDWQGWVLEHV